jgi:hypothetical protein
MGRPRAEDTAQPRELSRLRQWLDEWRESRGSGVAFPQTFWASAGRVARQHGVHATARALGLEYNKLKRASGAVTRTGGRGKERAVQRPVKLIEITGAMSRSLSGGF